MARHALLPVALLAGLAIGLPGVAHGEPRFGDSTWVAPNFPTIPDSARAGYRVAPPDHERTWETVLRTPFRIVFLPLRGVARLMEAGVNRYGNRMMEPKPSKPGIRVVPKLAVGGINDIGAGPVLTWVDFPIRDGRLDARVSWSTANRRRARLSEVLGPNRSVGALINLSYDSRPDRRYFGIGNNVLESSRSYLLLEESSAQVQLLLGASPVRQFRILAGYSDLAPRRAWRGTPRLEDAFAPDSVPYYHRASREYLLGFSGDLALLDQGVDPSLGIHGRVEWQHARGVRTSDPSYNQWLVEGRGYLPVLSPRRVLAFRAVYAGVDPTGDTDALPFYRLVMSDGPLRFAGYSSQRFRDRQLLLARAEYRWLVWHKVSAVALYELGEVAPSAGVFTIPAAHRSYGGGIRAGTGEGTALRIELATSRGNGLYLTLRSGVGF